ncbi:ABC transporter permease [Orbaceae bacterium ESL0721]|nr:ABC transporter permease [Orbaceae bacterium ESL0721]
MQEKLLTLSHLAWRNIECRLFRSCCLIIVIMLFSATLFAGSMLLKNLNSTLSSMTDMFGADILIVPYGHEKKFEKVLFGAEPSSFYLKLDLVNKLKKIDGIAAVSPLLFIASLSNNCCSSKVQLIGFDQQGDFVVKPWLQTKIKHTLSDDEIVIGSKIDAKVGDTITLFNRPFKVVAKMGSSGMGFDASIFMTMNAGHSLMQYAELVEGGIENFSDFTSSILIKVSKSSNPQSIMKQIISQYAVAYNVDLIMTKDVISDIAKKVNRFNLFVYGLSSLFWVLAVIVIFIIFSSVLNERKREIRLLRVLGASRRMLVKMLLRESVILTTLGGIAGIIFAGIFLYAFNLFICQSIGFPSLIITPFEASCYALLVFLLILIIILLMSIYSIFSITKFDTYNTFNGED